MPGSRSLTGALRAALLLLALLTSASTVVSTTQPAIGDEVRALWVTRATLSSSTAIAQMVRTARDAGYNTLIVQVRGRGDAYFASTIEPRASELAARPAFDPLAETISAAREAGLRVHAWVVVNLVSSAYELPASREHVLYRQPDWLMIPRELAAEMLATDPRSPQYVGKLARWTRARSTEVEGLFASPIHPGYAKHVVEVVRELAATYAVDGVHLDYVRYPNDSFDYSRATLDQFRQSVRADMSGAERVAADRREKVDPLAYPELYPQRFQAFRRARLTALVMRLRTAVKEVRPAALISAAVFPDVAVAYSSRLQDWRTWLDQSLIDVLCPMAYTTEVDLFETQIAGAQALAVGKSVWAGIGAYRLSAAGTLHHIAAARRLKSAGIILFSYDALTSPPNSAATFAQLSHKAFAIGSD